MEPRGSLLRHHPEDVQDAQTGTRHPAPVRAGRLSGGALFPPLEILIVPALALVSRNAKESRRKESASSLANMRSRTKVSFCLSRPVMRRTLSFPQRERADAGAPCDLSQFHGKVVRFPFPDWTGRVILMAIDWRGRVFDQIAVVEADAQRSTDRMMEGLESIREQQQALRLEPSDDASPPRDDPSSASPSRREGLPQEE